MTAISTPAIVVSAEQRKRARSIGITYLVLAAVCLGIFTRRPGDAGFRICRFRRLGLTLCSRRENRGKPNNCNRTSAKKKEEKVRFKVFVIPEGE